MPLSLSIVHCRRVDWWWCTFSPFLSASSPSSSLFRRLWIQWHLHCHRSHLSSSRNASLSLISSSPSMQTHQGGYECQWHAWKIWLPIAHSSNLVDSDLTDIIPVKDVAALWCIWFADGMRGRSSCWQDIAENLVSKIPIPRDVDSNLNHKFHEGHCYAFDYVFIFKPIKSKSIFLIFHLNIISPCLFMNVESMLLYMWLGIGSVLIKIEEWMIRYLVDSYMRRNGERERGSDVWWRVVKSPWKVEEVWRRLHKREKWEKFQPREGVY